MKLIDKDALVAEIEKLIDDIYAGRPFDSLSSEQQTALWYVKSIMSSVNTLEVKEVNFNDTFIDKACEWLKEIFSEYENLTDYNPMDDFKSYMKGE